MMSEESKSPPIKVSASGIITNPWYHLPPRIISLSGPQFSNPCIVTKSQLDLSSHGIRLYFKDDEIVFIFTDSSTASKYRVNPIKYFLTYESFIDWNIIEPFNSGITENDYADTRSVSFKILEDESEREIVVTRDQVVEFLDTLNPVLYNAIALYLIGCQFYRYFLVEYFKAAEIIENELGGERNLIVALKRYGVTSQIYKDFKRLCNNHPVDISRHAPKKGVPFYAVDVRNLLGEPKSKKIFESATLSCRSVIDAYVHYLNEKAPS